MPDIVEEKATAQSVLNHAEIMNVTSPKIIRRGHLADNIVIVDGQPGCGKTMLSPIVAAMERVEIMSYIFEVEHVCRLWSMGKLQEDAAETLVKMFTDHKLYKTMMGRDTNFRISDLSSVFSDSSPWRYLKRIFQEGDMCIPDRIKQEKPILNLTTHNLLSKAAPVFAGLGERVVLIEVVRHPLYMVKQQQLNMERLLGNPRNIQIYFEHHGHQLPYFAYGWEEKFISSNSVEKAVYSIESVTRLTEQSKQECIDKYNAKVLTIPFERFVLDPWPYLKKMEELLDTKVGKKARKAMKKQNVPRKMVADGVGKAIYQRCGWEPPKTSSNTEELMLKRDYVVENVSTETLDTMDRISTEYEKRYLS